MNFIKIIFSSLLIFSTSTCLKTSLEEDHQKYCRTARLHLLLGYNGKDSDNLELKGASKFLINYAMIELLSEQCDKKKNE